MAVQYAKTYVDRAFDANDLHTLYAMIRTLDAKRDLAEPLFLRLWEWICATRSGIWQYYENISASEYAAIATRMDRNNLSELATRYRAGMESWKEPRFCDDLDDWIETNESVLDVTLQRLIEPHREQLYPTTA